VLRGWALSQALSLVQGLKRNLPEAAPEYWARRNQMEDTLLALLTKVYEEVPVAAIVGKRVIKPNTGVVVEGDVEVAPGEPTELQYLVRWADAQGGHDADAEEGATDTEWLSAEFVAENVIECALLPSRLGRLGSLSRASCAFQEGNDVIALTGVKAGVKVLSRPAAIGVACSGPHGVDGTSISLD
jgi:hypothetical protein